jgi:hypothetical protein
MCQHGLVPLKRSRVREDRGQTPRFLRVVVRLVLDILGVRGWLSLVGRHARRARSQMAAMVLLCPALRPQD